MSATTPTDDDECHDLVLLFAKCRFPRGSDAFQSIVSDLLPDTNSVDGNDSSESHDSQIDIPGQRLEQEGAQSRMKDKKSVRMIAPKHLTKVHWPDGTNAEKISSSPTPDKRHSARIYVKTTPKPILKHEEHALMVDPIPQGQG